MTGKNRAELRRIINHVFAMGVNKQRMQFFIERFIDANFVQTSKDEIINAVFEKIKAELNDN